MPKIIQMPRRSAVKVNHRKETSPQEGVTSILAPNQEPVHDPKLRHYEKLAEIALSKPLQEESA